MTFAEFFFSGGIVLFFALFMAVLYISDRIKDAKIRRQFSKFEDPQEYEKTSRPWIIYIIGILSALLFFGTILFRIEDSHRESYNQGYEEGYEAGLKEGIDRVLTDPGSYFD